MMGAPGGAPLLCRPPYRQAPVVGLRLPPLEGADVDPLSVFLSWVWGVVVWVTDRPYLLAALVALAVVVSLVNRVSSDNRRRRLEDDVHQIRRGAS